MQNNTTSKVDDEISMFFGDPEKVRQAIQREFRINI